MISIDTEGFIRVGEFLQGTVNWSDLHEGQLVVQLRWQSSGRATHDVYNVLREEKRDPAIEPNGQFAFRWKIPYEGPLSFDGSALSVRWSILAEQHSLLRAIESAESPLRVLPRVVPHPKAAVQASRQDRPIAGLPKPPANPIAVASLVISLVFLFFSGRYFLHYHSGRQRIAGWYQGAGGYAQAVELQKTTQRPMLLYFGYSDCEICKERIDDFFQSKDAQLRLAPFIKVQLDATRFGEGLEIGRQYGTDRQFGLIVVHADGKWKNIDAEVSDDFLLDTLERAY